MVLTGNEAKRFRRSTIPQKHFIITIIIIIAIIIHFIRISRKFMHLFKVIFVKITTKIKVLCSRLSPINVFILLFFQILAKIAVSDLFNTLFLRVAEDALKFSSRYRIIFTYFRQKNISDETFCPFGG